MTPTAAVGVLDAIFWKPEFRWRVVAIDTLRPVQWLQVRRNEIQSRQTLRTATTWAAHDDPGLDIAADRTQRASLLLQDVCYVIHAEPEVRPGVEENVAKFRDQLRRRVDRGQCHERPYLGCREFPADFGPAENDSPIDWTEDLGSMVQSVYAGPDDPRERGTAAPLFFSARVEHGQLRVPLLSEGRR
jgi:CRISPR-associated protein Cas5d